MAVRSQPLYATYTAWNASTGKPQPGDAANHSINWTRDGVTAPTTNSPTEIGNGDYQVLLTVAETSCNSGTITGSSSTTNIVLIGVTHDFDPAPLPCPPAPCPGQPHYRGPTISYSPLASIPAALAQYNANIPWHTSQAAATAALEAIQYLLINRAQKMGDHGSEINYESLTSVKNDIQQFLGATAPRAFGRSRTNTARFCGRSSIE